MKVRLLFLLVVFSIINAYCIPFDHITINDGLSDNDVRCIIKDSKGYMWFGTSNGLNKYDGYSSSVYKHIPGDSTSLSGKSVSCIYEDSQQNLWIGTSGNGLNLYRPETDDFIRFGHQPGDGGSISHDWVLCMYEDSKGRLWIGTQNGLNLFKYKKQTFTSYIKDFIKAEIPSLLRRTSISDIAEDRFGNLWLTTWSGLVFFNPEENKYIFYSKDNSENTFKTDRLEFIHIDNNENLWVGARGFLHRIVYSYGEDTVKVKVEDYHIKKADNGIMVYDVAADKDQNLWIATANNLYLFNKKDERFTTYEYDPLDTETINSNIINTVYLDNSGIFWFGTKTGGVSKYNQYKTKFFKRFPVINNANTHELRSVKSIYKDKSGKRWLGTDHGLLAYNGNKELVKLYTHNPEDKDGIGIGGVTGIIEDSLGNMWISNWGGGVAIFDRDKETFTYYRYINQKNFSNKTPGSNSMRCMIEGRNGNLWIGNGNGYLDEFNPYTRKFTHHFIYDKDSLRGVPVVTLAAQPDGTIWAGAFPNGGLSKINSQTGEMKRYFYTGEEPGKLPSNEVYSLYADSNDNLWVGTDVGLLKYDKLNDRFEKISGKKGLPQASILSIVSDHQNNLWLSTPANLIKYRLRDSSMVFYDESDGFPLSSTVSYLDDNGQLLIGGINGIIEFDPDNLAFNKEKPPVILTSFRIRNEPVKFTKNNPPFNEALDQIETIKLKYDQAYFSFQFAALNYSQTEKNQYAYMLEGFDEGWNYSGTRRTAYYTNVPPGKYRFRVKASNNDGVWNDEGTSVAVLIRPPWFKTGWAYVTYALLTVFLIFFITRIALIREKLRNKIVYQQLEMEKQQELSKKEHELAETKLQFFTNISHEFRTPLTLIQGPIEKLYKSGKNFESEAKKVMPVIHRNSQRLLILIEQLLTFRRLNNVRPKLNAGRHDLVKFIKSILDYYKNAGYSNELTVKQNFCPDEILSWFDPGKMEQILHNLFSNCFKYACHNGTVKVSVTLTRSLPQKRLEEQESPWIKVSVFNTGECIPVDKLNKLFERFYRANSKEGGAGIGLSVAKSLVEMHHGIIAVKSTPEMGGVEFQVYLPKDDTYLSEDEKVENFDYSRTGYILSDGHENQSFNNKDVKQQHSGTRKHEILIIEDNKDLRSFLADALEDHGKIQIADNGELGLHMAEQRIPDIIISDVLMPGMDGFEVVAHLKSNIHTSHIPVILLTAKTTNEDKITGYKAGADAYVEKPFNVSVLKAQIDRLLKNREIMQKNYKQWIKEDGKPDEISENDHSFIMLINKQIEASLANGDVSVNELSELGLPMNQVLQRQIQKRH